MPESNDGRAATAQLAAPTDTRSVPLEPGSLAKVLMVREEPSDSPIRTYTVAELPGAVSEIARRGIEAVKVFATDRRDESGRSGEDPDSVMGQAIRAIKAACPWMQVWTETCLCSYLTSGDCFIAGPGGAPDIPATVGALSRQAVAQAQAGADVVGPAAMIAGSVAACRMALRRAGHDEVGIMPHLIVDSRLYNVYRGAMGITPTIESRPFQLPVGCSTEAVVNRAMLMVREGATAVLVEPALFAGEIIARLRAATDVPLVPFSVSGECTALPAEILVETYTRLLRAGATCVLTHSALAVAATLGERPIHHTTTSGKQS